MARSYQNTFCRLGEEEPSLDRFKVHILIPSVWLSAHIFYRYFSFVTMNSCLFVCNVIRGIIFHAWTGWHAYLMVINKVGILRTKMRNTTIPMRSSQIPKVLHFWGHLPAVAVLLPRSWDGVLKIWVEVFMLDRLSEMQAQFEKTGSCKKEATPLKHYTA